MLATVSRTAVCTSISDKCHTVLLSLIRWQFTRALESMLTLAEPRTVHTTLTICAHAEAHGYERGEGRKDSYTCEAYTLAL